MRKGKRTEENLVGASSSNQTDPLYEFISEATRTKIQRISEECTLESGLGLDDYLAAEFLHEYSVRYNVNCEDLDLRDYFWVGWSSDYGNPTLFQILTEPPPEKDLSRLETKIPISVMALREGIKQGIRNYSAIVLIFGAWAVHLRHCW